MEGNLTVEEVLKITIKNLSGIQLPVMMAETATRIAGSIKNIQICLDAIECATNKKNDEKTELYSDGELIETVKAEESEEEVHE